MGAKFVAGIIGLIIVIVLIQTCILDDDDSSPSINRPGSIPTATPPAEGSQPVLLGEGSSGSGCSQSTSGPSGNTYTVQSGDTLGAIAQRFSVPADGQAAWIAEVLRLNNMQDARQLQAGQELKLPTIAATARPSGTSTPATGRHTNTDAAALLDGHGGDANTARRRRLREHVHRRLRRQRLPDRREALRGRPWAVGRRVAGDQQR